MGRPKHRGCQMTRNRGNVLPQDHAYVQSYDVYGAANQGCMLQNADDASAAVPQHDQDSAHSFALSTDFILFSTASRYSPVVTKSFGFPQLIARSFVMMPCSSTTWIQASSRLSANLTTSGVPSSSPRFARPRVHAKMDAMGLV